MSSLEGLPEVSCGIVIPVDFAKWFCDVQDFRQSKKNVNHLLASLEQGMTWMMITIMRMINSGRIFF